MTGLHSAARDEPLQEAEVVLLDLREEVEETSGDRLVREAFRDEAQNLSLPRGQLGERVLSGGDGRRAALIVTEWAELTRIPLDIVRWSMRTPLIVDGRNLLGPDEVRAAGILYEGVGRPS